LRHVRTRDKDARVEAPVHAIYFQYVGANDVEILRILHERMDPALHIGDEF
jgi:plasmid stabilization system protein ParE